MVRLDVSNRYIGPLHRRDASGPAAGEEEARMNRRSGVLTLAVLGLLHESPMHGYELRKRLNVVLGTFRAFSYGTLYPCLKDLLARGWIVESDPSRTDATAALPHPLSGRRGRIVYQLTAEGKERFQDLLADSGPSAWEDEHFDVHFAFFARTDADTRLRILEGRRSRLQERLDGVRQSMARTRERLDSYTLELQRHGLESVEREVRWLDGLIEDERHSRAQGANTPRRRSPRSVRQTEK
jgi:DNA-binding PadR family transcriptional regulator